MQWYRDFLDDLRHLLDAGVPVREALESLGKEPGPRGPGSSRRATLANTILDRVGAGSTLGEALAASAGVPQEHAAMVEAGERTGTLGVILGRIVARYDRRNEILKRHRAKVIYYLAVVLAAVVLTPLYLVVVGRPGTYLLVQLCFFTPLLLCVYLVRAGPSVFGKGSSRRELFEALVLQSPWVGGMVRESALGKAFGLLGTLLESGLSAEESIRLTGNAVSWESLGQELRSLGPHIRAGKSFTGAFESIPVLARPTWTARIAVGEKAGRVDRSLQELGAELEEKTWGRLEKSLTLAFAIIVLLVGALLLYQGIQAVSRWYGRGGL